MASGVGLSDVVAAHKAANEGHELLTSLPSLAVEHVSQVCSLCHGANGMRCLSHNPWATGRQYRAGPAVMVQEQD
jgi:hypothetical protein